MTRPGLMADTRGGADVEQRTCLVDGCVRPLYLVKAGLCQAHAKRLKRIGSLEPVTRTDLPGATRRVTCLRDGCDQELRGRQRQWCTRWCEEVARGLRLAEPRAERICPAPCGRAFVPKTSNQVYCTGRKGRCYRRATNAAQRGPAVSPVPESFNCARCRKHCVPGLNVASHASKFCGAECKVSWHSHHVEGKRLRPISQVVLVGHDRSAVATWRVHCTGLKLAEWGISESYSATVTYRRQLRADPCSYCGGPGGSSDHIDPQHNGGADDWTNRTSACRGCNSYKGTLPLLLALLWVPAAREYHSLRRVLHGAR